jgi:hypothetical protein
MIKGLAALSSLAMDPPPGVQYRGDVPERPVARRTRFPAGVVLLRGPGPDHQGAPSAFADHEPENRFAIVCDSMPGFDSLERPGKSNRLRSATGWT